jgi:ATP-dependent helicase/nuclease subunit B
MKSFLREVAQDLIERFGDDLKNVAIVFNNKRPVSFLKKHLGELYGKPFWSPSFFTMSEFLQQHTDLQIADPLKQFFVLHQQYQKLFNQQMNPDQFYPMAEIILSDYTQIDYDLVNADELFLAMEDISRIQQQFEHFTPEQQQFLTDFWSSFSTEKQYIYQQKFIELWKQMPDLYTAFHNQLYTENLTTTAKLYRNTAQQVASLNIGYSKIVLIGFNALNRSEEQMFKYWQDSGRALFYFDVDEYYFDDQIQEAGLFVRRSIHSLGLVNALPASNSIKENKGLINVIETQGHTAQAKALKEFLDTGVISSHTHNPEHLAIILADESLLLPVLQTIPQEAGIVNVTMGYSLAQSTVFGFIDLWLNIQQQINKGQTDWVNYRDVEAFLSHPLSLVKENEKEAILGQLLKYQYVEVPITELHFSSLLAPNFFTVKHDGLQSIDALYLLLTAMLEQRQKNGELQQLEANLIMEVCKKLNILYDGLRHLFSSGTGDGKTLPLQFVFALIRKTLQGLSVPLEGEPLKGIQVMGLLESRCLDFEHVIILGVNEGTLPRLSSSPTFIPDSLRRAYRMPVLENQDAIFAYFFYRLLQRSSSVSLVYNGLNSNSDSGEPSRFLKQLEFESNFKFKHLLQQQQIRIAKGNEMIIPKTGAVWSALQSFFNSRGRWDDPKISATALTTYINCPIQFFFRYVAKIKEPEVVAETMEANMVGSILHHLLEWFYEELVNENSVITYERIQNQLHKIPLLAQQALSYELFNKDKNKLVRPNSMQQIILHIVSAYAQTILEHDSKIAPFQIIELENKESYKCKFTIDVQGTEQSVLLYGIIDRVDQKDGKIRIVDYKTGGRDELKYVTLDDLFDRESKKSNKAMVQTMFYTYIYEKVKRISHVEPHLYIVRKMKKEGTAFFNGSGTSKILLQDQELEEVKTGFVEHLRVILEEIFNPDIPFLHTTKPENCSYCPYKEICGVN